MFWDPDDAEVMVESGVIDLVQDCCQNALFRLVLQFSDRCICH